ncbi:MAG TPA: vancomycin resistance histidine kinase VanS, partial [Lachnospiraceae bacterium]|nr:vancomycin resistance histidine kinase VanS [Lachnospiraceae bacterium]
MFHRKQKKKDEFKTFKDKIFSRTILLAALAVLCIWILYSFIFYGNFANWVVAAYQKILLLDYDAALHLYQWTFRNYMEIIFIIAISIVFFIIFRIYLNWFTKYFEEVNSGLDDLMNENAAEISLSPELLPIERKMNTIRHTIAKQKNDILLTEQRKNDLIVYLAHDLKTPLASVIGYLNLLHDAEGLPENLRKKYLSISLDKAERLEDLINEFFEIARFNLSDIILQYSKINLARLVEQLTFEFNPMLREKNLTCKTNIPDDIMLKCDADKIQRAFDNLLRNAVIYSF